MPTREPDRVGAGTGADLEALGFGLDGPEEGWLERLRQAETPMPLGRIGPYELLAEVSRGGQGVVFQARQPGTQRLIALKRPVAGSFSSSSTRLRFEREVEAAAALNHPNIITVYGMETVDGLPVYAMEWVEGVPVTTWSQAHDPRECLEVFLRICDAVQHAHSRGVLHRDLKPSNILVDESSQPHVLDFGLAKRTGLAAGESDLTLSAEFVGTPAYAAPEQLQGRSPSLDQRADVYALGVILFEMLAGEHPFGRPATVGELVRRVESASPQRLTACDPHLGREIDVVVRTAMAGKPEERYQSVEALARDVRCHLAGEPIHALPPSSWYLLKKLVQRNRLVSALVVLLFAVSVAFAVFSSWQSRQLREALGEAKFRNELYEKVKGWSPDSILKRADLNPYYPRQELTRPEYPDPETIPRHP